MKKRLFDLLHFNNPWLTNPNQTIITLTNFIPRQQLPKMLDQAWDKKCTVLIGPRQAGKTTLGKMLCQQLIDTQRFSSLLYINCDEELVREWLIDSLAIQEAIEIFKLKQVIIFIDEVQRLTNPGLLIKSIIDAQLNIKLIASGSSQLEIKSKVSEHLTGRQIEFLILPLSYAELKMNPYELLLYGCYPSVVHSKSQAEELAQLYHDYFNKDIIEFLKVKRPQIVHKLLSLIAHSSGQLVNYQQLANDLKTPVYEVRTHLDILEKTFVIASIMPFVGNKRKEITSNPILYFIDNGFRNQALRNFLDIESAIFQELLKAKDQHSLSYDIHYWRTQSNAEVDFILYFNDNNIFPIEAKHSSMNKPNIPKSYRSFIEAYQPKIGFMITKDFIATENFAQSTIYFLPFAHIDQIFAIIKENLK
jgi:predicted AAA+ superfamily ATPase